MSFGSEEIKPFTMIAVIVFAIIGIIHIARVVFGWEVEIHHIVVPLWTSVAAAIASGILSFMLWRENKLLPLSAAINII